MSTLVEGLDSGRLRRGLALPAWGLASAFAALVVLGCVAHPAAPLRPAPPPDASVVPPGVDSLVAVFADSLADASFVEVAEADEAEALQRLGRLAVERTDSLWLIMSLLVDSAEAVSAEDSTLARKAADDGGSTLVELDSLLRTSQLEAKALASRTAILLDSAEHTLERSFQLNPFDTRSRVWLAQVYGLQARRLGKEEAYAKAIDELEKLALLTPDQHSVFAMLANSYFYVSNWDGAARSYEKAEAVYMATFDLFGGDPTPLDSALVFSYARAQGDMHVERLDGDRAVSAYQRARDYAVTPEDSDYIAGQMEWMAWDDLNIATSLARDSLLALEQAGDLAAAHSGYVELLPLLSTRSAADEIEWRLSIVDYNLGNAESAAERLQSLLARTATNSLGEPVDPTYTRYFDDYGTLCLNLGRVFRMEHRDSRTALKYFAQASDVSWSGRAVAHYEVARLVQSNVSVALEHAEVALAAEGTLTDPQRVDLYRLLMELYRRAGDFDRAREFRDAYRTLRGG